MKVNAYEFDFGTLVIPADIADKAAQAPTRAYWSPDPETGELRERQEPDCPELDAWVVKTEADWKAAS